MYTWHTWHKQPKRKDGRRLTTASFDSPKWGWMMKRTSPRLGWCQHGGLGPKIRKVA